MESIIITPAHVTKSITELKSSVSRSPDSIPSLFLKQTCSSLSKPLASLFTLSLKQSKLPSLWKKAIVTPIYKKGLRCNASNYRPISLTSVICRTMERILHNHLINFFFENNIISDAQYGFMPGRSTLTQQLTLLNELTINQECKAKYDIVYLDFEKAFDSVSHSKLLHFLNHLKLDPVIHAWISDYLSNRYQQTIVQSHLSELCVVTSGVPQGSVLGPLLFAIYLGELLNILNNINQISVYAFADDLKIVSCNPTQLQTALDLVETWSHDWQLKVQPIKSEHISFSLKSNVVSSNFFINQIKIPECDQVKDLGLILSNDLKWSTYVNKIHSRAVALTYTILKSFKSTDPFFYTNLYKLYVRPIVEYNVNIWMPCLISHVKKIESVQALFSRKILQRCNIKYKSYFHRLEILNLESLEVRRLKADLILFFKILNNLVDLDSTIYITKSDLSNLFNLRRHTHHLKWPTNPKSTIRRNFFTFRIINLWNSLPDNIVTSKSLSEFKLKLATFNLYKLYSTKL